jgi:hypothetical protein
MAERAHLQTNREQSCQLATTYSSSVTANSTDGRSLTRHCMLTLLISKKGVNANSLIGTKDIFSVSPTLATSRVVRLTRVTRVWLPSNAQRKLEPPILTVRNPQQTMLALRRASLCNCRRSGYLPKATGTRWTQPREFLVLANTSIWWTSADSRHRSPSIFLRLGLHLTPTDNPRSQQIKASPDSGAAAEFPGKFARSLFDQTDKKQPTLQ